MQKANKLISISISLGRYVKQLPIVLGCDFAGTIEKLGGPIQGFQEGQRIFGFTGIGTKNGAFAEYTLVDPEFARPVPDNISNEQAAGMNLCALTAAMAVFMVSRKPAFYHQFPLSFSPIHSPWIPCVPRAQAAHFHPKEPPAREKSVSSGALLPV